MNRFLTLALLSISLCFAACDKDKDDKKNIPAGIQARIDLRSNCTCLPYINLYQWKGQDVYLEAFRVPACNWVPAYFDAQGNEIAALKGATLDTFLADATFKKTVWACKDAG